MPFPKRQVCHYRLVHIREKDFLCERKTQDTLGEPCWTVDKEPGLLVQVMAYALIAAEARYNALDQQATRLQKELFELKRGKID